MVKVERAVAVPEFLDVGNNLIVPSALVQLVMSIRKDSSSIRDAMPNAAPQPRPESAAQRRLKGVGCRRWFGSSVAPIVELVAEPLIA
jgi:hypothetical protein